MLRGRRGGRDAFSHFWDVSQLLELDDATGVELWRLLSGHRNEVDGDRARFWVMRAPGGTKFEGPSPGHWSMRVSCGFTSLPGHSVAACSVILTARPGRRITEGGLPSLGRSHWRGFMTGGL